MFFLIMISKKKLIKLNISVFLHSYYQIIGTQFVSWRYFSLFVNKIKISKHPSML